MKKFKFYFRITRFLIYGGTILYLIYRKPYINVSMGFRNPGIFEGAKQTAKQTIKAKPETLHPGTLPDHSLFGSTGGLIAGIVFATVSFYIISKSKQREESGKTKELVFDYKDQD
jgi:hypothetical protein